MKTIITFGTFDIFHVGHLAILQRAKALGDRLVVGVSSDRLNLQKKQRNPIYSESERIAILRNIKDVDDVFLEESLEEKAEYIQNYRADILAMGDDWEGHFDHFAIFVKSFTSHVHRLFQPQKLLKLFDL